MLNPEIKGIGHEALAQLYKWISGKTISGIKNVQLFREYQLRDHRRLDLLILFDDHLIAIENRVLSSESENQTKLYL
ncbi:PD-(D/E)XK nuclease family protein [Salinibacillus aidingensis]|uniref:PD-(D/E)XK nuclease family protein n=1 Tax=Salinibacillus aidingensis TaxID=237684 RepID=UPI003CD05FE8